MRFLFAGTNRALLCKSTVDGLQVTQLNMDHTTENEDELFRFSQLGEYCVSGTVNQRESAQHIVQPLEQGFIKSSVGFRTL